MDKLSGINLNLLTVLNALLKEQNVSAAAKTLNLTQPTVSNSLKQLREIFDDELLIRGPRNRMILTYKAKSLISPVNEAVMKLENLFEPEKRFDPSMEKYNFKIGMSDYAAVIVLPKLIEKIRSYDDNITLSIQHLNNFSSYDDFIKENIDFAIGNYSSTSDKLNSEVLFSSKLICIANRSHPAFSDKHPITKKAFFKYKHIWVLYKKEYWEEVSEIIAKESNRDRKVSVMLPHLLVSLSIAENSNYICLSPDKLAYEFAAKYNLKTSPSPFDLPESVYCLFWSKPEDKNPAIRWLRNEISQILF